MVFVSHKSNRMASKRMVEDVTAEILAQLPVKSLMRFKSLSKFYYDLIRDNSFVTKHFQLSAENPRLLIFHYQGNRSLEPSISLFSDELSPTLIGLGLLVLQTTQAPLDLGLPFAESSWPPLDTRLAFPNVSQPSINLELPIPKQSQAAVELQLTFPEEQVLGLFPLGLCKGIFCLYVTYLNSPDDLILWNPATREVKVLPLPNHPHFEMKKCIHGFGIDPNTNDYKVVRIWMENGLQISSEDLRETNLPIVEVYSLKSNSWRKIDATLPAFNLHNSMFNSYLDGVYYWLSSEGIVCFDMSNEVFWKMKSPTVLADETEFILNSNLAVLNDSIAYVLEFCSWKRLGRRIEIWVMNEHGVEESWTKRFSIGPLRGLGTFRGFWKDGEILAATDNGMLISYNLDTQKPVLKFPVPGGRLLIAAYKYVESIVPLSGFVVEEA